MTCGGLESKISDLFEYVQERCLWQFSSRTWDRQENIDGVLDQAVAMFLGRQPVRDTPMQKLHGAEARILVDDCRQRYPWTAEPGEAELQDIVSGLKLRLIDLAITQSHNRELNHHLY